jgi:hypothetical protein
MQTRAFAFLRNRLRHRKAAPPPAPQDALQFVPRDAGLFSNINFLVGEICRGVEVFPLFAAPAQGQIGHAYRQFAYVDPGCANSWFEFFAPISYGAGDTRHLDSEFVRACPPTTGESAAAEFRIPAATLALYRRPDFGSWRARVHAQIGDKIKPASRIRGEVEALLATMPARRIGVHVRHPSHMVEQGRVLFDDYFRLLDARLAADPALGIFLATDTELAVAAFRMRYGERVTLHRGATRASIDDVLRWAYALTDARPDEQGFVGGQGFQTHFIVAASGGGEAGLRAGREAARDLFTLAACDELVCTISNFTLACAYLHPQQRHHLIAPDIPS